MDDWWSYTLSDLLLFSPRTYYRMVERHNERVWPAHVLTLALGFGCLLLVRRATIPYGRIISAILATAWLWVGWAFVWQRYATINWAMTYVVPLFAIEALLLAWVGTAKGWLIFRARREIPSMLGVGLFAIGVAFYPLLAIISGRPWEQGEIFGMAPDPTAAATVGLLLTADGSVRWRLMVVPLLWCAISGATLWAMGSPEALVMLGVLGLAVTGAWIERRRASARALSPTVG